MSSLEKILHNAIEYDDERKIADFIGLFKELYRIPLFKPGLDATVTRAEMGLITFKLEPRDVGERIHGCCISQEVGIFNKIYNSFVKVHKHLIRIQSLNVDTIMHEIAHALEKESRIDLAKEFSRIFYGDLSEAKKAPFMIREAIKQVLQKDIENYPNSQHNSEYLARFYQLLAMAEEIGGYSDDFHFKLVEIKQIFPNTMRWIEEVFNPALKAIAHSQIVEMTKEIEFDKNINSHARKHKSKFTGDKKWSKVTGSLFNN